MHEFSKVGLAAGFMSCMIAILYFLTVYALELLATSTVFRPTIRALLTDYAYVFATMFWVGFSHIPGNLKAADISRVPISRAFYPTQPRGWLIHFWELDVKWVFAAMPFGSLVMLLFYYDHVRLRTLTVILMLILAPTEHQQSYSPSPPISPQKAHRLPLGLLPPRHHHLPRRYNRRPHAQRPSPRAYELPRKLPNGARHRLDG